MVVVGAHGVWETLFFSATIGLVLGHNFWLIVKNSGRVKDAPPRLEAHVGHHFPVSESALRPERVDEFTLHTAHGATPIVNFQVEEQALVATIEEARQTTGAQLAALTVHPRPITINPELFAEYINEEEAAAFVAPHFQEGVTKDEQLEIYSKYAKAFVATDAADETLYRKVIGHQIEIVPEVNPATLRGGGRLPLRVLFAGQPIANLRISSSCDRLNDGAYFAHARTDEEGRVTLDLSSPGYWSIRSHYIRLHPNQDQARWESFWPSLTLRIDE